MYLCFNLRCSGNWSSLDIRSLPLCVNLFICLQVHYVRYNLSVFTLSVSLLSKTDLPFLLSFMEDSFQNFLLIFKFLFYPSLTICLPCRIRFYVCVPRRPTLFVPSTFKTQVMYLSLFLTLHWSELKIRFLERT